MPARKSFKKKAVKVDVSQKVTDAILDNLKSGVIPWVQQYKNSDFASPTNLFTGKGYTGLNVLLGMMMKDKHQFESNAFLTFAQASKVAGISDEDMAKVRDKSNKEFSLSSVNHPLKGQKSCGFVVYNSPFYKDRQGAKWQKVENGRVRTIPTQKEIREEGISERWYEQTYSVWNVEQMSHVPEKWMEKRNNAGLIVNEDVLRKTQDERLRHIVQNIIKKSPVKIEHSHLHEPDFDREKDVITMPRINAFVSDTGYYRALMHQLVHWTGGEGRLNRPVQNKNGEYDMKMIAEEELVAELGSVFLCLKSGVDAFSATNIQFHSSMVNTWISLLEDNKKAISVAASRAEKAVGYLEKALKMEFSKELKESALEL